MSLDKKLMFNWLNSGGGSSYSDGYQAILDKAAALGAGYEPPSANNVKAVQDAFYQALVAHGLIGTYADLVRVRAHVGAGSKFHLINWANPDTHLASMPAGDLTVIEGGMAGAGVVAGNGTKYIDENYNPSTEGVKYQASNAFISYYKNSTQTINTALGHAATVDVNNAIQPFRNAAGGLAYMKINGITINSGTAQTDNGVNLWSAIAFTGSATSYKNGTAFSSNSGTSTPPNSAMRSCWNGNGSDAFFSAGGGGISATQLGTLKTLIEDYLAELFFLVESEAFWDFS